MQTLPEQTLCKLADKGKKKDLPLIAALVVKPKFLCRNCYRTANDKNRLCKSTKIKKHLITETTD